EWVHVQLHQQKGMISLSPPTICNSAGLCGCMEISTMLQLCATLLIVACDGSREMANLLKITPKIAEI
ncbi:hypothetical protein, partial [Klebsiella pneumoniae]|uniref:hypothetical protein n=1 Tax=Klebsiella pneumoniae TaxID=573 RepID=UPI00209BEEA9